MSTEELKINVDEDPKTPDANIISSDQAPTSPHGNIRHHDKEITLKSSLISLLWKPINVLLIFIPFGIIAKALNWSPPAIFFLNFFAIIPLSKLLGTATEEIALRTSDVLGGLLNATFGNAVELIISAIALSQNLIRVVQASLLGSILSNLLLVCGFCFFVGGLKFKEQFFNITSAQTASSMLTLSVLAVIVPAMFSLLIYEKGITNISEEELQRRVTSLSRGTSIVLLIMYGLYLFFQLKTHRQILNEANKDTKDYTNLPDRRESAAVSAAVPNETNEAAIEQEEEDEEEPSMTLAFAIITLLCVTAIISLLAEYMVSSIEGFAKMGLSETFIGLVLVPIVGNAAEHISAISVSLKNKMELALSVAIGSSCQVALFIVPLSVIIGWCIPVDMNLDFHIFETVVLFMTVLIINYLIQDGKSNWLEGMMCLTSYFIIALSFYYYP